MQHPVMVARRPGAPRRARARVALRLVLACLLLPLPSGCYLLHVAGGQLALSARRVPIPQVLADPRTPPALRAELGTVLELRRFAADSLGLPAHGSYGSYADIGRPYVVWNVFATGEFSVSPRTWCFPVAGCVAYRGYFSEGKARRYAARLQAQGADVFVGGVAAYSTLGHFRDPVLSTMRGWDEAELADLIFHELAHQRVYLRGDSAFNEAFATVVAGEGVRRWLTAHGAQARLEQVARSEAEAIAVAGLIAGARADLAARYRAGGTPAELRAAKAARFAALRAQFTTRFPGGGYAWLFNAQMNNASLLTVATYYDCVPGLHALLAAPGTDLEGFYARAKALSAAERRALCTRAAPAR